MGVNNHLVQNNFGASLGGPIYCKHTFFFVNYEGFRQRRADMIDTVPTLAEITGDFSQSGVNIYDPNNCTNPSYNPACPSASRIRRSSDSRLPKTT